MGSPTVKSLSSEMEELRAQLAALTQKLARLEVAAGEGGPAPEAPAAEPAEEHVTEDLLLVLSAAVAAYLGKRAPIRAIRLLGSGAWAQQGRVSIQASHGINVQHNK